MLSHFTVNICAWSATNKTWSATKIHPSKWIAGLSHSQAIKRGGIK